MSEQQNQVQTGQEHVYRARMEGLILIAFLFLFLVFITFRLVQGPQPLSWGSLIALCMATLLVLVVFVSYSAVLWHVRLVLAPQGIAFYSRGYNIYSPWENVAGRTSIPLLRSRMQALYLREAAREMPLSQGMQEQQAAVERSRRFSLFSTYYGPRIIPIGYFFIFWSPRNKIAQEIQQYCPQDLSQTQSYTRLLEQRN